MNERRNPAFKLFPKLTIADLEGFLAQMPGPEDEDIRAEIKREVEFRKKELELES